MVFTIHRYIFRDLLKTFLLASLVLSVVLGLGMMLQPLRKFSVDPSRVPELLLYTLPITLTMVIPIAALLAATLNYGRLAADNEIAACRSSGMGLLTLIYPALALALMVGIACLLLAFHVIPSYTERFESIIKTDAESIIYNNIRKRGNLGNLLPGIRIHADYADPENHRLIGVVVLRLDQNELEQIITARQVDVRFEPGPQTDRVLLRVRDGTIIENDYASEVRDITFVVPAPTIWRDDIKFKTLVDLKAIAADMTRFRPVAELLDKIRQQVIAEHFFEWCDQQLAQNGYLELTQRNALLRIYAGRCAMRPTEKPKGAAASARKNQRAQLAGAGDWPVKVAYFRRALAAEPEKRFRAKEAQWLISSQNDIPIATLTLRGAELQHVNETLPTTHDRYALGQIKIPPEVISRGAAVSLGQVRQTVNPPLDRNRPSAYLDHLYQKLKNDCDKLEVEIDVERHCRLAFGISCIVLVLFGAALGVMLRSAHLLTAFGISFIPAALCLITIFTGKHIAEQSAAGSAAGIAFLWSGIVAVSVANFVVYKVLLRH